MQFKRDDSQNSKKLHLDQYYTSDSLAQYCIDKTFEIIGKNNITEIIEPSAGAGAFSGKLDCVAYDIEPKSDGIIKQDYLSLDVEYKKGRLIIGNPPYGSRCNLAKSFCNKSFEIADYVAFILPISQWNNTQSIYKFDLIYSENLGKQEYSGMGVHCCFNIYKRPDNGKYNKRTTYKDSDIIEIREIREIVKSQNPKRNRELGDFEYDFAICNLGAGIGTQVKTNHMFYIKIKDRVNLKYWTDLILNAKWQSIYPMTAVPALYQWQVYKYVEDNKPSI